MKTWIKSSIGAVGTAAILGACGSGATEGEVRIAYFPNLTHIATIVALENDYFAEELGDDVSITTRTVPDGGAFMEAMTANEVDIGTVVQGPR